MHDRLRAIEILREARDLLVHQLSERIVAAEERVLDDARGETYGSEIESLYEGLGLKLSNITAMLAALRLHHDEPIVHVEPDLVQVATHGHQAAYVQTDTNEFARPNPHAATFDTGATQQPGDSHDQGGDRHG
ncbi:MAG: hypothetical protein KF708_03265 [Pirellulales bacterium]|nr:hypothetical protein [Pirellulales bacterium]